MSEPKLRTSRDVAHSQSIEDVREHLLYLDEASNEFTAHLLSLFPKDNHETLIRMLANERFVGETKMKLALLKEAQGMDLNQALAEVTIDLIRGETK